MCKQTETKNIPVIDFSNQEELRPGSSSWLEIRQDVINALEQTGCFIAQVGNKVPQELRSTILEPFKELMEFPLEVKMKNKGKRTLGGYYSATEIHESIGIDNAKNAAECQKFTDLFWPNGNEKFFRSSNEHAMQMMDLDGIVTRMVFENYGVEKYHDIHINKKIHYMSFVKYKRAEDIETDVGLLSHTDKNFIEFIRKVGYGHIWPTKF